TGDDGLSYEYNVNHLHNNLAIEFAYGPPWLAVPPTAGTVAPGGSLPIHADFDATGLLGLYRARIRFQSNDPLTPVLDVPVSLNVELRPTLVAQPDHLDFGNVFIGYPITLPIKIKNTGGVSLLVNAATSGPDYDVTPTVFVVPRRDSMV